MVPFLFIVTGIVIVFLISRLSEFGAKLGSLTREMQFMQRRMLEIEQELLRHRRQGATGTEAATTPEAETLRAAPPTPASPPVIADQVPPAPAAKPVSPVPSLVEPPVTLPAPPTRPQPVYWAPPQPVPAPRPAPAASSAPQEAPRWTLPTTREGWEELIGGNLFNRIGAIAVVIGLALALLYAIQEGIITPPLRIALGYAVGIALLLFGYRSHRRGMTTFAQGLIGAGIAVCYLCGYASYVPAVVGAFDADPMVGYPAAFILMTAAAILAFQQAILYDSLAVALLGWVGGFLTPFILRSGNDNVLGLLTYLAFLTLGMVALVIWRDRWAVLEPLTLVTTYLIYLVLSLLMPGAFSSAGNAPIAAGFLIAIWAMFHAADLYRAYQRVHSDGRQVFAALNLAMMWALLYLTLNPLYHDGIAAVSLGMGVVYFAGALLFERLGRAENRLIPRSTVSAIVLLALATWIALHGFTRITAWSVEAAVILWSGLRWQRNYAWISALNLFGVAFVVLLFVPNAFFWQQIAAFTPVLNPRVLAFLALAAGLLYGAIRFRDREELRTVLHYGWISLVFALLAVEINDGFRLLYRNAAEGAAWVDTSRVLSIALSWTLCSLPLLGIGFSTRIRPLIVSGLLTGAGGALLAVAEGVRLSALTAHPLPTLVMRGIVFVLIIATLFFHAAWTRREQENLPWLRGVPGFMHVLIAALGFELVALEILDAFSLLALRDYAGMLGVSLGYARSLLLAVGWTLYGALLIRGGLQRNAKTLYYCGYLALVPGLFLLGVTGLAYDRLDTYAPVLNARAAAFAIAIAALSFIERAVRGHELPFKPVAALQVIQAALAFQLVTVEIIDLFRLRPPVLPISLLQAQFLALAAGWGVFAAFTCWIAGRKRAAAMFAFALLAGVLGVATLAVAGLGYAPAFKHALLFNPRSLAFAFVIVSCLAIEQELKRRSFPWTGLLPTVAQVITALLIFQWVSVECWAYYAREIYVGAMGDTLTRLKSFQQMSLSIAWVVYAILVTAYGFARRIVTLRLLAIVVFELAIFKIFIFDFASLETLNRIFSFIGLGIMLLATSYLYQRYKHLILGPAPASQESPPQAIPPDDGERDERRW